VPDHVGRRSRLDWHVSCCIYRFNGRGAQHSGRLNGSARGWLSGDAELLEAMVEGASEGSSCSRRTV